MIGLYVMKRIGIIGLILMLVLGLLALILSPTQKQKETEWDIKNAKAYVTQIVKIPLVAYRIDTGDYPTTEEGFEALLQAPKSKTKLWKGPYIEEIPLDPWGNRYQYIYPGKMNEEGFDVFSFGQDGITSEDDITNWKKSKS